MGLSELKQKIQMQIENADERLLRIVSSVFDNYWNEDASDNTTLNSMALPEKKSDRRSAYSSGEQTNYFARISNGRNQKKVYKIF